MKTTLTVLRAFSPSRSYKWEAMFSSLPNSKVPAPPRPYSDWFPAQECEVNLLDLKENSFSVGGVDFSIPSGFTLGTVSLLIVPDEQEKLVNWLQLQENLRKSHLLPDIVVGLHLVKYSSDNRIVSSYNLIVYLASSIRRSWNSDSGIETIPLEFKIAGFMDKIVEVSQNENNQDETTQIASAITNPENVDTFMA